MLNVDDYCLYSNVVVEFHLKIIIFAEGSRIDGVFADVVTADNLKGSCDGENYVNLKYSLTFLGNKEVSF